MKKFLVEDIQVGVSKGGIACGPVGGLIVAEICLKNMEDSTICYHALTEVEGTLSFVESSRSTFDIQITENYDDKASWTAVETGYAGGYTDYDEFYEDLNTCDEEHRQIWKFLAFLVRAGWDEVAKIKTSCTGKYLSEIEIPVCDAEQEYLEEHGAETDPANVNLDSIRDSYVGFQVNVGLFDFPEGESPEGDYTLEETFKDKAGNEYKCIIGFDLDENGIITHIPQIVCKKLIDKNNNLYEDVAEIPEEAYELLQNELEGMI